MKPHANDILRLLQDNPMPSSGITTFSLRKQEESRTWCIRLEATRLPAIVVRVALIGTLQPLQQYGKAAIGIMITAADYDESYNGIEIVAPNDSDGNDDSWLRNTDFDKLNDASDFQQWFLTQVEKYSTTATNTTTTSAHSTTTTPAVPMVRVGRDTREHSESLAHLVIASVQAAGARVVDQGEITTPCLHYCVAQCNNLMNVPKAPLYTLMTPPTAANEDGYYELLARSYASLVDGLEIPQTSLLVDCAGGVGYLALRQVVRALQEHSCMRRIVPTNRPFSAARLNDHCGAAYVRTKRMPPVWHNHPPIGKDCCASLSGAAEDVVFFSETRSDTNASSSSSSLFVLTTLIDEEKVVCLLCHFLQAQIKALGMLPEDSVENENLGSTLRLGALLNGPISDDALKYLNNCLGEEHVIVVTTENKEMPNKTERDKPEFDVCINYLPKLTQHSAQARSNILCFRDGFYKRMQQVEGMGITGDAEKNIAFRRLGAIASLCYSDTASDGLSNLLLMDAILRLENMTIHDWDSILGNNIVI